MTTTQQTYARIARKIRGSATSDGAGVKLTRVIGGGDLLRLAAGDQGARLILVAGRPLLEPVMRHGPFVMDIRQELMQAFVDFQEGRF